MSLPPVPQRPVRSLNQQAGPTDVPQVPPRPARRWERSQSPTRESFTRSPLNDSPFASKVPPTTRGGYNNDGASGHERAPSVSYLPLIGQEGMEYASLDQALDNTGNAAFSAIAPTQTINVAGDLPLHAPRASVAPITARSQIAPVTRTNSSHAAVLGIGKPTSEYDDSDRSIRPPSIRSGQRTPVQAQSPDVSRSASRPESMYEKDQEQGIPVIGLQVPMYPNAGDVQAPSPAPISAQSTGVGYFNDSSRVSSNNLGRRKSAQLFHGPPGSYGMHGHGVTAPDPFEKAWYHRHPEELAKEQEGAYGPGMASTRGQWALTSEELNKLVRESSSRGPSMGTNPGMIGTPSEQIGYRASEEYALRLASPRVQASLNLTKSHSHTESPLRKASFPGGIQDSSALDNELEDDAIHLDPPSRRGSKIGGGGYDPPTEDLGPHGGNTEELGGWIDERGRGTPILASDEIAKNPGAEYLQPAISPELEKAGDDEYFTADSENAPPYQSGLGVQSRSRSRPNSRPTSIHEKSGLSRFASHEHSDLREATGTPLEDVAEYEPLFEDDDEEEQRPFTVADRLKRPELERHRFPSQDIWEDTPNSLQLSTTVTGPQEPDERQSPVALKPSATFEPPEKELARKGEILESERLSFLTDPNKGYAKPKFNAGLQQEVSVRPGMRQRFPSRDIWEDTPDSLQLETTIDPAESANVTSPTSGQQVAASNSLAQGMEAADPSLTAPFEKPAIPARPVRSKGDATQPQPSIPPRPLQRGRQELPVDADATLPPSQAKLASPTESKAPALPERPKPQVPARPTRVSQDEPRESTTLTKTTSAGSSGSTELTSPTSDKSVTSPPATKPKPIVPSRPAGNSKFAALKAGFMNDLNSRLQMGPQAPPRPQAPLEQTEEEKAPLADARKGRARGPARRKPAEPAGSVVEAAKPTWSISKPLHAWSIDPSAPHHVKVGQEQAPPTKSLADLGEAPTASPLARNTAGETLQQSDVAPRTMAGALAHEPSAAMDARAQIEEMEAREQVQPFVEASIGHPGDVPEPVVDQPISSSVEPMMGAGAVAPESTLESKHDAPTEPLLSDAQPEPVHGEANVGEAAQELMPGGFPTGVKVEDVI